MTTFLLVRHGTTDAVGKILAGSGAGWGLNEEGKRQVQQLSASLASVKLDAVYTSPLERTRQTAWELSAPHRLEPQVDEALREMNFGEWEGRAFQALADDSEWQSFNRLRSEVRPPGGELIGEVQARMAALSEQLRM